MHSTIWRFSVELTIDKAFTLRKSISASIRLDFITDLLLALFERHRKSSNGDVEGISANNVLVPFKTENQDC